MIKKRTIHTGKIGGADAGQITMRIQSIGNGVTKLISGRPDFEVQNFNLIAKACFQSDSLMIIDFNDLVRYDKREIKDENSYEYKYREKFPTNVFKKSLIKNTT